MSHDHSFQPLLLIMGLAFLVPILVSRLRWLPFPPVVIVLVCGIILGDSGLGWVQSDEILGFLSLFGFVYLMFLSGMEIDFRRLQNQARRPSRGRIPDNDLARSVMLFLLTLAGSGLVAWIMVAMDITERRSLPLLTLIFCTTSVGLVMPVLKEGDRSSGRLGQIILLSAVMADILTIIALSVVLILMTRGFSWDLAIVGVFGFFLLASMKVGDILSQKRILGSIMESISMVSPHMKVRGALLLLLVFVGLTEAIGLEVILGAFLAGAFVSLFTSEEHALLIHELEVLGYGFFIPIFFVMVGVTFDASVLSGGWHTVLFLVVLVGGAYMVKLVPSMLLFTGILGARRAVAAGMLLSSRLSLIIAIAAIGQKLGLISSELESAIILLALFTCIISPAAFQRLARRDEPRSSKVVIAGAGRFGRELARRLLAQETPVTVLDKDPALLKRLPNGARTVECSPTDPSIVERAAIEANDIFVALTSSDERNLRACLLARDLGAVQRIIARCNRPRNSIRLSRNGIVPVDLVGTMVTALENLVQRPGLAHLVARGTAERSVYEVKVDQVPEDYQRIKDFAALAGTTFICVRRSQEMIVPRGNTELRRGDHLLAFGPREDRRTLRHILGP